MLPVCDAEGVSVREAVSLREAPGESVCVRDSEMEGVLVCVPLTLPVPVRLRVPVGEAVRLSVGVGLPVRVWVPVPVTEDVKLRDSVREEDGGAQSNSSSEKQVLGLTVGLTLRVRLTVARGLTVGARLCERLLESDAEADGDPDGEGVLLPEREGDAPTVREAVDDAVWLGLGVLETDGAIQDQVALKLRPGLVSPKGATATRKRLRAETGEAREATSGISTTL